MSTCGGTICYYWTNYFNWFFLYFVIMPILGKLEARLILNSNVCKDLSPHKLSHILKKLLDVVK
jgi:hypothetical protein